MSPVVSVAVGIVVVTEEVPRTLISSKRQLPEVLLIGTGLFVPRVAEV
jgi:hypothetical protein